jgi:hypothetical protein
LSGLLAVKYAELELSYPNRFSIIPQFAQIHRALFGDLRFEATTNQHIAEGHSFLVSSCDPDRVASRLTILLYEAPSHSM